MEGDFLNRMTKISPTFALILSSYLSTHHSQQKRLIPELIAKVWFDLHTFGARIFVALLTTHDGRCPEINNVIKIQILTEIQ